MHDAPPGALQASIDTPITVVSLAATASGIVALELMTPPDLFRMALERRLHAPVEPLDAVAWSDPGDPRWRHLERAIAFVAAYFDGRRPAADFPLDLEGRAAWDQGVFAAVRGVGWGQVTSYGRLARRVGSPGAARAIGGAVGRNPIGLVIPCHRVIAGDGSLGGYGGDWWGGGAALLEVKRRLLELEGVTLPARFGD